MCPVSLFLKKLCANFFSATRQSKFIHQKFVDILADPQLWICSLVSSTWRGLKERSMSLRSEFTPTPMCNCTWHCSALFQTTIRADFVLCSLVFLVLAWQGGFFFAYSSVLAMMMFTTASITKLSKKN